MKQGSGAGQEKRALSVVAMGPELAARMGWFWARRPWRAGAVVRFEADGEGWEAVCGPEWWTLTRREARDEQG